MPRCGDSLASAGSLRVSSAGEERREERMLLVTATTSLSADCPNFLDNEFLIAIQPRTKVEIIPL